MCSRQSSISLVPPVVSVTLSLILTLLLMSTYLLTIPNLSWTSLRLVELLKRKLLGSRVRRLGRLQTTDVSE